MDGFSALCAFSGTPDDTSAPWEWTDLTDTTLMATGCNGVASVAHTYIDTIVGYFAPRACVALGLNCDFSSSTIDLSDADVNLRFAPNPASDKVSFTTDSDSPIQSIKVYSLNGALVNSAMN